MTTHKRIAAEEYLEALAAPVFRFRALEPDLADRLPCVVSERRKRRRQGPASPYPLHGPRPEPFSRHARSTSRRA